MSIPPADDRSRGRRVWQVLVILLVATAFIASIDIFSRTNWSADTILQFEQARSGRFTDHHPPIMAAFWRLFVLAGHPQGMIWLQIVSYWAAVLLLLWNAPRSSAAAVVLLVFPTTTALIGVIWKDAHMAIAWALAWSLLLVGGVWRPERRLSSRWLAAPLIVYGSLVRHNGFIAVPPLLMLLLAGKPWLKSIRATALAYFGLAVLMFAASQVVTYGIFKAESPRTAQMSLVIFDMAAITSESKVNAFPVAMTEAEQRQVSTCYSPRAWDPLYYNNSPCRWTMDRMMTWERSGGSITKAWLSAVGRHPLAYLKHRARYSNQFFCIRRCNVSANGASFVGAPADPLVKAYIAVVQTLAGWVFAPLNALLGCALVGWIAYRGSSIERPFILGALFAAALNLLSFIPFGVASDQRYAYPSFVLLAFAAAALLNGSSKVHKSGHLFGTGPISTPKHDDATWPANARRHDSGLAR